MAGSPGDRADDRHVKHDIGGQEPKVAMRRVVITDRDRQHGPVERERSGVIGDDQTCAGVRKVLQTADLDAEPPVVEEPQRGQHDGVVVLRIETEFVDAVVPGQPFPDEVGKRRNALGEVVGRWFRRFRAPLIELADDGFNFLRCTGRRFRQRRGMAFGRRDAPRSARAGRSGIPMQRNDFGLRVTGHVSHLPHLWAVASMRPSAELTHCGEMIGVRPRPRTKSSNASRVVHFGSKPNSVRIRVVSITRPKLK